MSTDCRSVPPFHCLLRRLLRWTWKIHHTHYRLAHFFFSFHWSRIQWNAKGEMELNNTNSDARTLCRELRRKRPIVFIKSIPLNECWRETLLWAEKKTEWKRKRANVPDPRPNECRQSTPKTTKWWTTTFRNRSETMLIKTTCAVHYNKLKYNANNKTIDFSSFFWSRWLRWLRNWWLLFVYGVYIRVVSTTTAAVTGNNEWHTRPMTMPRNMSIDRWKFEWFSIRMSWLCTYYVSLAK